MEKKHTGGGEKNKKVRRRMHVSRPYQEGIMNMAEARKEIADALKTHRASMKQVADNNILKDKAFHCLCEKREEETGIVESEIGVRVNYEFYGDHGGEEKKEWSGWGEEELKMMRSIGEQHQMEWDDAMSLVSLAWWWGLLHNMDQ